MLPVSTIEAQPSLPQPFVEQPSTVLCRHHHQPFHELEEKQKSIQVLYIVWGVCAYVCVCHAQATLSPAAPHNDKCQGRHILKQQRDTCGRCRDNLLPAVMLPIPILNDPSFEVDCLLVSFSRFN